LGGHWLGEHPAGGRDAECCELRKAVAWYQNARKIRPDAREPLQQLDPVEPWHHDVGYYDIEQVGLPSTRPDRLVADWAVGSMPGSRASRSVTTSRRSRMACFIPRSNAGSMRAVYARCGMRLVRERISSIPCPSPPGAAGPCPRAPPLRRSVGRTPPCPQAANGTHPTGAVEGRSPPANLRGTRNLLPCSDTVTVLGFEQTFTS
jgi:hypothetical protein